jgi:hypothetical protein
MAFDVCAGRLPLRLPIRNATLTRYRAPLLSLAMLNGAASWRALLTAQVEISASTSAGATSLTDYRASIPAGLRLPHQRPLNLSAVVI